MQLGGEQRIAASRERVWEGLNDPAILKRALPGCESLERDGDNRFAAVVEIKIGPIGARFKGAVTLTDLDAPNGYTIVGEGQGGIAGSAKGEARVTLTQDGDGTLLRYNVEAQVGGRLAQLGGPIIDATAKRLAGTFFSRFEEALTGKGDTPGAGATLTDAPPSASNSQVANSPPLSRGVNAAPVAAGGGVPVAWLLALVVAGLVGFLVGRSINGEGSDWMGLAIGLLLVIVGAAGIALGRSIATPAAALDEAALLRLIRASKE